MKNQEMLSSALNDIEQSIEKKQNNINRLKRIVRKNSLKRELAKNCNIFNVLV